MYKNCPLPTPHDRLFFLLTYLKTYSLQVMAGVGLTLVQGRLFGMGQSKANQWIHVLLPALQAALGSLGDTPSRSLTALAGRRGVTVADAAAVVTPLAEDPESMADTPVATAPPALLLPMTVPRDASCAPKTLLNRAMVIAARKKTTR